jgi:Xaa-Pro aminopeptidase
MPDGLPRYACRLLVHGIGLASLERPEFASGGGAIIEAGEVLRIEAQYYEIGSMGLAVRDTLLITSAGARAMNRSRHDLVVLD